MPYDVGGMRYDDVSRRGGVVAGGGGCESVHEKSGGASRFLCGHKISLLIKNTNLSQK